MRPSARALWAPISSTCRPRMVAVVDPVVWCTILASSPNSEASCNGLIRLRSIVWIVLPTTTTRPLVGASTRAIRNAISDAMVLPLDTAPVHRASGASRDSTMDRNCLRLMTRRTRISSAFRVVGVTVDHHLRLLGGDHRVVGALEPIGELTDEGRADVAGVVGVVLDRGEVL